jgi:hypothetical protein
MADLDRSSGGTRIRPVNATCVLVVACVSAGLSGCSEGDKVTMTSGSVTSETAVTASTATATAALIGHPQGQILAMPAERSTRRFTVTALPPAEHTWDVHVVAPADADVAVRIRTWYGQRLRVLDTTHDATSCEVHGARSVCSLAFPRLEAQRGGAWEVIVLKRSEAAAGVAVEVTFNKE